MAITITSVNGVATCPKCGHEEDFAYYEGMEFVDGTMGVDEWTCEKCGEAFYKDTDEEDYTECNECGDRILYAEAEECFECEITLCQKCLLKHLDHM